MNLRITRRGRENMLIARGRAMAAEMLATQPMRQIMADADAQAMLTTNGMTLLLSSESPMRHDEIDAFLSRVDDDMIRDNLPALYAKDTELHGVIVGGKLGDWFKQIQAWLDAHPTIVALAKLFITLALMMLAPARPAAKPVMPDIRTLPEGRPPVAGADS